MSDFKVVSIINPTVVLTAGPAISAGGSSQVAGTINFANSNGVSFGLSNGTLTASAVGGGGNTSVFANGNGVTFGTAGSTVTASVATNYMASNQSSNFVATSQSSLFQQTSNTSAITSNAVNTSQTSNFAGTGFTSTSTAGSNIVATHGTNGLSMGVPNFLTTTPAQTAFVLSNSNNVSFGTNGSTVTASASFPAQTAYQFSNSNGVSFGTNGSTVTASIGTQVGTNTGFSGTNVSGSMTVNSNGVSLALSAAAGGGGGGADGNNVIGVNGGATQATTTYQLSNSNNVSFGLAGGTITASASYPAQTVDTNKAGTGYTSTTQAGSTVGATQNTQGLSMAWPPFLTTFNQSVQTQASGAIAGSGFTTTTTNGSVVAGTNDSGGLKLAVPPYITTYAAQTTQTQPAGNIAGVGTSLNLTNLTGTLNVGTNGVALSLSAAAPGGGGAINVSAGTTSGNLQSIIFSNSNNHTFGLNGSTVTVSYSQSNQPMYFSANNGTGSASTLSFKDTNGVSWSTNANGIEAIVGSAPTFLFIENAPLIGSSASVSPPSGAALIATFVVNQGMTANIYRAVNLNTAIAAASAGSYSVGVSAGAGGSSGSTQQTTTGSAWILTVGSTNMGTVSLFSASTAMGVYMSASVSTNGSSATASYSVSSVVTYPSSFNSTGGYTTSSVSSSISTSFSATSTGVGTATTTFGGSFFALVSSGYRPIVLGGSASLTPGKYAIAHAQGRGGASTGQTALLSGALLAASQTLVGLAAAVINTTSYYMVGDTNSAASGWYGGFGFGNAVSTSRLSNTVALSDVTRTYSNAQHYFNLAAASL